MVALWVMQTVLTVIEIAGGFWGIRWILREKAEGLGRLVLAFGIGMLTILTVYQRTYVMYSRWWLALTVLFCGLLDFVCYKGKKKLIWIFHAVYFETLYFLDLFGYIALKILRSEQDFLADQYVIRSERIFIYLVFRIIMIGGLSVLCKNKGKTILCLKNGWRLWIAFAVVEHASLIVCDSVFLPGMEDQSVRGWKNLLLVYPFLLVALVFFFLQQHYRLLYMQIRTQDTLYVEQIKKMEEEKREKEKIYHDLRNHLIALQGMISDGDYSCALDYLKGLLKVEEKKKNRLGVPVLDYLIQNKVLEALRQNIEVQEQYVGGFPELDTEGLTDWCVLFGNLWDNSLEGCMRIEGGRRISFSVRRVEKAIAVRIENNCLAGMDTKKLFTMKADPCMHGIGLKNIEYVVDKYGGTIKRECKDGVFVTQIAILITSRNLHERDSSRK